MTPTPTPPAALPQRLWHLLHNVSGRLVLGAAAAGLAAALAPAAWGALARGVAGWVGFAATSLALIFAAMHQADAADIRRVAATDDLPRTLALAFVVVAALSSLAAVLNLPGPAETAPPGTRTAHLVLGVAAVVLAWLLVHTVFTLRYAHTYYDRGPDGQDAGGLLFPPPAPPEPNYLDFAYYAYVVGMTAQTADIAVNSRPQRLNTLVHGLISFLFNTVIVALTISTVGGLLK